MPCDLTTSFTYSGCGTKPGGISKLYFGERQNLLVAPTVAAGVITAMQMKTGKMFREYDIQLEISGVTDDSATPKETGLETFTPMIDFTIMSLLTSLRQEIRLMSQNRLVIMALHNDNVVRVYGITKGMLKTKNGSNFGIKDEDGQKQILHFEGTEPEPAYELTGGATGSIMTALLAPGV